MKIITAKNNVSAYRDIWRNVTFTMHSIDEIVDDDDFIAGLQQFDDRVTADETGTAGHEDCLLGIHASEKTKESRNNIRQCNKA